jgi:DNA-binding NarL/FixJ family response regulator
MPLSSEHEHTTLSCPAAPTARRLSPREKQVTDLLLQGCENLEIARELKMTTHNVKAHLRRLFVRLEQTGGVKRVGLALKLYRRYCLEDVSVEGVTEAASESGESGLYGSRVLTQREELVAGLVAGGLKNRDVAEVLGTQPPHLYFSSVLSCTGLADCHCGGKTRLDPARGQGVQVHDGSIRPHNKDCGCSNCTKWESCTEGVVKNYLQIIYDKSGKRNQVELALWYEARRYGRMSPSEQTAYRRLWLKIYERREQQKEAIRITMPLLTDDCPAGSAGSAPFSRRAAFQNRARLAARHPKR